MHVATVTSSRRQARRRITLRDVMLLVAATALGIVYTRHLEGRVGFIGNTGIPWTSRTSLWIYQGAILASPCAVCLTAILLLLRWLPPRCNWRRLTREPGTVACVVTSVVVGARTILVALAMWSLIIVPSHKSHIAQSTGTVFTLVTSRSWPFYDRLEFLMGSVVTSCVYAGWSIAAIWLLIGVMGRWRHSQSWLERLGRLCGWYWIAFAVLTSLVDCHLSH
jgi:hypothetical protein